MEQDEQRNVRILVVDDEPTITEFLETGLSYEGYTVQSVADGAAALSAARAFRPDLVILDVMLPGMDGFEVLQQLHRSGDVAVLMLTARDELDDTVRGLEVGADDYLVKPFKFKELLARVRAVLRRRRIALPHILQSGDLRLDRDARQVSVGSSPVHLTPREFDLLETLLAHPGQVLTKETLLNRVWGYDYIGDTNVVEVHVSALRDKIGDRDASESRPCAASATRFEAEHAPEMEQLVAANAALAHRQPDHGRAAVRVQHRILSLRARVRGGSAGFKAHHTNTGAAGHASRWTCFERMVAPAERVALGAAARRAGKPGRRAHQAGHERGGVQPGRQRDRPRPDGTS